MVRSTVILAVICLTAAGCLHPGYISSQHIKGNGEIITETRETGHFTDLRITGAHSTIVYGDKDGPVRITGDSNILANLRTDVENGRLVITSKSNTTLRPTQRVEIEIPSTSVSNVRVSGSNRIVLKNIDRDSFKIRGSGSTRIEADGYAGQLDIRMSGSSGIEADGFISESVTIRTSGSSRAEIFVSDKLESRSSGSSRIVVHGHPKEIENQSSGSSRLRVVSQ